MGDWSVSQLRVWLETILKIFISFPVFHEIQRSSLICPFDWGKQTFLKLAILWVGPCSTVPMKPPKVGSDIQDDQVLGPSIPRLGMDTKWFRWGVHKPSKATERLSHDWNFWIVYRCFQGPLPDPSGIGSSAPIEVCDSCQARKRSNIVKRPEQLETISRRSVVFLVPLSIVQESYSKNAKQKKLANSPILNSRTPPAIQNVQDYVSWPATSYM